MEENRKSIAEMLGEFVRETASSSYLFRWIYCSGILTRILGWEFSLPFYYPNFC